MSACGRNKFRHPGAEIVVTDNHLAIAQQPVDQIATDKPGCTCHKGSQDDTARCSDDKSARVVRRPASHAAAQKGYFMQARNRAAPPDSEHKSCRLSVVVEHFDGVERVVAKIPADE